MESTFQAGNRSRVGRDGESHDRLPDEVRDAARAAAEQLKTGAQAVGKQARQVAAKLGEGIKNQTQQMATQRKEEATEKINHLTSAFRGAAQKLHEENDHNLAGYVETAAEKVEGASRYLKDRSVSDLLGEVRTLARQHPGIFLGGMVLAGFILTRFLRASDDNQETGDAVDQTGSTDALDAAEMA